MDCTLLGGLRGLELVLLCGINCVAFEQSSRTQQQQQQQQQQE